MNGKRQRDNRKTMGQVRDERKKAHSAGGKSAPNYTASYKVNHSDELLEFLLRKCNTSRNNVKSLLVRRQVLVNGSVVTQYNFPLAKDDEVKIAKTPQKEGATLTRTPRASAPKMDFKIVYEDDDFIAIDKPAGLLSVESDKETDCAFGHVFSYLKQREKNARPFVLHRIDKETSGVLVFAKNPKVHSQLKLRWSELVQSRVYIAVVEGAPLENSGTITSYLKENVNNLVYSTQDPTGQKAITHYETLKTNEQHSLLRVKIDTGRKNQIRVHMKSIGCAVVGDDKYGAEKNPLGRLGLHAVELSFIHPFTKELITITASTPPTFWALFGN